MDSRRHIKRTNVEVDRLSSLPDDLIHRILSLNGLKCAIGTSVLSSRWRYIWSSMPFLDFSSEDFSTLPKFSESVNHVLSRRNNQVQVYSIKLSFRGSVTQDSVKQILNYAFSHNIQHLEVTFLLEDDVEFPFSLFSCHSLKHLSLKREFLYDKGLEIAWSYKLTITSILDLPALTTLYLRRVTLSCDDKTYNSVGPFSKCTNIKNLTLESCKTLGYTGFSFSHPLLSNLTLVEADGRLNAVEVIAPQLKSLTIKHWSSRISYFVTAPHLESLVYDGHHPLFIFSNGFGSLEKVDLRVSCRDLKDAPKMFSLLQHLHSVKFLRLNLEIVELLSSSAELVFNQPSPFSNLKSLKIYPKDVDSKERTQKKANMSVEVKNYLLDGSPSATFTMVSREEVVAKMNTDLAQERMDNLRSRLEWKVAKTETNRAQIDRRKKLMESDKATIPEQHITELEYLTHIEETDADIDACWEKLNWHIEGEKSNISNIISSLHDIKEVLIKLPTSNRAELQPSFQSLCTEANIVVNKIMDRVKNLCDMKGSRFNVYIDGLATTSLHPF
ncbi:F-box domain containing protein [Tanacetum coccineum]